MTTRQLGLIILALVLAYFAALHSFREPACRVTWVGRASVGCEPLREPLPPPAPSPRQNRSLV
jgi:hypothetical protein